MSSTWPLSPDNLVTSHSDTSNEKIVAATDNKAGAAINALEAWLSALNIVSVASYGADPAGLTDSSAAFQSAINALPATGGIVLVPAGNYLINTTITIGNGAVNAPSTRTGIRIVGAGATLDAALGTRSFYPSSYPIPTRLFTSVSIAPMIQINGPISSWGLHGLELDGVSGLGAIGLKEIASQNGDCSCLSFRDFHTAAHWIQSLAGTLHPGLNNSEQNFYRKIAYRVPTDRNFAKGLLITSNGTDSNNDAWGHVFDMVNVTYTGLPSAGITVYGVYLGNCDTITIRKLMFNSNNPTGGGGTINNVLFNYNEVTGAFGPSSCTIEEVDLNAGQLGGGTVRNGGTPPGNTTPNCMLRIFPVNGAFANPTLANLTWGYSAAT